MPWHPNAASWDRVAPVVKWQALSGLSAGMAGILSAALWAHAALQRDDLEANSAAAGFSGAVALFTAGTVSFPLEVDIPPWVRNNWNGLAYAGGFSITVFVLLWVLLRWLFKGFASTIDSLLTSLTGRPSGDAQDG